MSETRLTVLSYGKGQDSHCIFRKLVKDPAFRARYAPHDLLVVSSDTGDEHRTTSAVQAMLGDRWMMADKAIEFVEDECHAEGIPFMHLTKDKGYHREKWQTLQHQYDLSKTCGLQKGGFKSCTDNLKIHPIYSFLSDYVSDRYSYGQKGNKYRGKTPLVTFAEQAGRIRVLIGIAKGEESRLGKEEDLSPWMRQSIERCYPLTEIGYNRQDCQDYIFSLQEKCPYPSNCRRCPWMSLIELLWLFLFDEEAFWDFVRQEKAKLANPKYQHLGDKNTGVWGTENGKNPTLEDKLAEAMETYKHMTIEQIDEYKRSHGHCVKSKY